MHCLPFPVKTICSGAGNQSLRARYAAEMRRAPGVPLLLTCRSAASNASGRSSPARLFAIMADWFCNTG